MPDLDGLQATRRIRDAVPTTEVVVLTMHGVRPDGAPGLDAGALGYVLEIPIFQADSLVKAVKDVSAGKQFLTPRISDIVLKGFLKTGNQVDTMGRSQVRPTSREVEVIQLLAEGKANKEIAIRLGISIRTVETHRAKIMLKVGVHSLAALIHYAIRHKIFTAPSAEE